MIKDSTKPLPRKARGSSSWRRESTDLRSTALGAIEIDLGDHFSHVFTLDSDGAPCGEEGIGTSEEGLRKYFEGLKCPLGGWAPDKRKEGCQKSID
jgi:hypothetical protein